MDFSKKPIKKFTSKIPHSNFKERYYQNGSEVGKCSCGKSFDFASERDMNMKFWLHHEFCSKVVGYEEIRTPKKAMTPRE